MAKKKAVKKRMIQQEENSSFLNLKDIFGLCLSNWFWFVLCFGATYTMALLYMRVTPPVYTRTTSIVIKEDANNEALENIFNKAKYNRSSNTTLNNEMIALKKTGLMAKVIERLHLDYEYQICGRLRKTTLYASSLPINATIDGSVTTPVSFRVRVVNDKKAIIKCNSDTNGETDIETTYGRPTRTPIGIITITKTPAFSSYTKDDITVTKISIGEATNMFVNKLDVNNSNDASSVIDLALADVNIQRADDVLNTLIAVYNESWIENRNKIIIATNKFINERLEAIEQELGDVESEMTDYKISNHTLDYTSEGIAYIGRSIEYENKDMSYENELALARYFKSYISNVKDYKQTLPISAGITNEALSTQVTQYNTLILQRSNLVAVSSDSNPLVTDLDKQLDVLKHGILVTIDNHIGTLATQVKMLKQNDEKNNQQIDATPGKQKKYIDIERRRKIKEQLYTFLLQTREQNELNQAFEAYNTRVLQPAGGSNKQTFPDTRKIYYMVFAIGLGLPFAFIVIREWMNSKVRGRRDIEKLSVPFVGELPMIEFPEDSNVNALKEKWEDFKEYMEGVKARMAGHHHHHKKDKLHKGERIVVKHGSRNVINEAFRVLRTNVEFIIGQDKKKNVIMTTSSNPGSGKTFISYNLALCMSLKKKKTCAIDLDLRRRNLSAYVNKPDTGLSDYINGTVEDWHDILVKSENSDYLYLLPVGTLPPNPAEILAYDKFAQLIDEVRKEFDYVFFDCPPVEIVADTSIISKYADITLFVIRVGLMELDFLNVIDEYYTERKYNNMGIILNGTLTANSRYGYRRYGYRYGYGYGYGYGGYGYYGSGYSSGYSDGYSSNNS